MFVLTSGKTIAVGEDNHLKIDFFYVSNPSPSSEQWLYSKENNITSAVKLTDSKNINITVTKNRLVEYLSTLSRNIGPDDTGFYHVEVKPIHGGLLQTTYNVIYRSK